MGNAGIEDAVQLLRTVAQHRDLVRVGLEDIARDLQRRSLVHDLSKLSADEFAGFSRINRAAREHPYGSEEYRAGLRAEKPTVELHYSRNSHHPEFHELPRWSEPHYFKAELMGFLDIIEMVCDWRGAYLGYGSQGTWEENIERQRERYKEWFSKGQWWLIEQVAAWLVKDDKRPEPAGGAGGDEREAQRRSFAYGNAHLSNCDVTRQLVDEQADAMNAGGAGSDHTKEQDNG